MPSRGTLRPLPHRSTSASLIESADGMKIAVSGHNAMRTTSHFVDGSAHYMDNGKA